MVCVHPLPRTREVHECYHVPDSRVPCHLQAPPSSTVGRRASPAPAHVPGDVEQHFQLCRIDEWAATAPEPEKRKGKSLRKMATPFKWQTGQVTDIFLISFYSILS